MEKKKRKKKKKKKKGEARGPRKRVGGTSEAGKMRACVFSTRLGVYRETGNLIWAFLPAIG